MFKSMLFFSSFTLLTILYSSSIYEKKESNDTPAIFLDSNFRGDYSYVDISRSNLGSYNWNDAISSVTVPYNWKLVFYEHKDFCGSSFTVNPGNVNFKDYGWNDKASSVKVYFGGVLQGFAYSCDRPVSTKKKYINDDPGGKWK